MAVREGEFGLGWGAGHGWAELICWERVDLGGWDGWEEGRPEWGRVPDTAGRSGTGWSQRAR